MYHLGASLNETDEHCDGPDKTINEWVVTDEALFNKVQEGQYKLLDSLIDCRHTQTSHEGMPL